MTTDHVATRTLVKSPPELWAECSDPASLGRHIGEFGEITITRLAPETTVDWEGEHASGTVQIEPSGWGTRVTLTAQTTVESNPEDEEEADAEVEETLADPDPAVEAEPAPARGRWKRLIRGWFSPRAEEPEPVAELSVENEPQDEAQPEEGPSDALNAEAILSAALDSLGQAHHRPFSRA